MAALFTPYHRGGSGDPLVLLHGFSDTWRTWDLVLPALERRHDVLAVTLAGHAGGPELGGGDPEESVVGGVERTMDAAGFDTAHIAGNSLGGWCALKLAVRGRARSVVALAPAGGWAEGDRARGEVLAYQDGMLDLQQAAAPHADAIASTPEGRRRATSDITTHYEHLPPALVAHLIRGGAAGAGLRTLLRRATDGPWELDAARIECPVRVVWGTEDRLLPWPSAAHRFRHEWLPHADWVELDGIGHAPQLDVPLETSELILGFTAG